MTPRFNPFDSSMIRGPLTKWNAGTGHFSGEIPSAHLGDPPKTAIVANDSLVTWDFGHLLNCLVVFKPKFLEVAVPMGCGTPQIPPGQEDLPWQAATRTQLLFDGTLGLRSVIFTSVIALNSLASIWQQATFSAEVQAGKIGIYLIRKPNAVPTDFGTYHGPLLEIVDYIERDPAMFGPRLTPPPPPILTGSGTPLKLTNGNGAAVAAVPPANDSAPHDPAPSVTTPVAAPAVNDLFARYRPAGAGRRPY
jgi:hypothetical protein